jgi:predicted deacylase
MADQKMQVSKQQLGNLKRGVQGYIYNTFEKTKPLDSAISREVIGTTTLEKDIECYKIGSGKTQLLFVSAIHGNEVGTVKLARELISYLSSETQNLRETFTFYIVPCLNIDGYIEAQKHPDYFYDGRTGRFNANRVDLNRNFATPSFKNESIYASGKDYAKRETVHCGTHGNSEPETQALVSIIQELRPDLIVAFHNKGADVMGNNLTRSDELARTYALAAGFKYIDQKTWAALGQTGTLKEWTEVNNIPYLEVEGSTRWGSDWNKQKEAIENLFVNLQHRGC